MKKILPVLLFIFKVSFIFAVQKVGIPILHSVYKDAYKDISFKLEEELLNIMSDIQESEIYSLNINKSHDDVKKLVKLWRDNQKDYSGLNPDIIKTIEELKDLDYCVFFELKLYNLKKEPDFYDQTKISVFVRFDLRMLIVDCREKTVFKEESAAVEHKSVKEEAVAKKEAFDKVILKSKNTLLDLDIFKPKIYCDQTGYLHVRINKGIKDKIRSQNILTSYEDTGYNVSEYAVLKVLWAYETFAIASVLYAKGKIGQDTVFYKKNKINLEIQACGGFSLSSGQNEVSTGGGAASFLPFASVRALIPVGLSFFRPGFHLEFNIFYAQNRILLPVTFEAGCQFEVNARRFQADIGFMFGALFAPDRNSNYLIDSFIVRPYLHLSAIILSSTKIFGEAGYRYYLEGAFYKDHHIDMNGAYFLFGVAVTL